MEERLKKQLEFILEADKSKFIGRQTYLSDGIRKENDAEHSWHLALMTALLSEYAKEKIDVQKTMLMVLIHDIVEIDAGDTYAYDEKGKLSQRERDVSSAVTTGSISLVTTMLCSLAQMVPLSKVLESRIRFTAMGTSAVRWI